LEDAPEELKGFIGLAMSEIWITERDWWADKYFEWRWGNSRNTAWCAIFMNWLCRKAWFPESGSNVAESFIYGKNGKSGKHVWMCLKIKGKFYILWWNQSNEVRISRLDSKSVIWCRNPKTGEIKESPIEGDLHSWYIIVTGGWSRTR
jgi:hypothetical protein